MKEKSIVYTTVFYISVLITAVLIAIMIFAPSEAENEAIIPDIVQKNTDLPSDSAAPTFTTAAIKERSIEIREGELKTLLDGVLSSAIGIHVDSLIITSDRVCISAQIDKSKTVERIEALQAKIGKAADIALKLAPDTVDIDVEMQLTTEKETQEIQANIKKLSFLGFNVPIELIPDGFDAAIGEYLSGVRDEYGLKDLTISLRNGVLILTGL